MNYAPVVEPDMLSMLTAQPDESDVSGRAPQADYPRKTQSLDRLAEKIRPLSEIEREAIEHALELCDGDVRKAAVFLDIAPATIYRKLKAWEAC